MNDCESCREWATLAEALGAMLSEPRPYHNARGWGVWDERRKALLNALDNMRSLEPQLEVAIMAVETCNGMVDTDIGNATFWYCTRRKGHDGECAYDPLVGELRAAVARARRNT